MILNKIKLYNFKSFTEFELDFTALNSGIHYISGPTGIGKTTIAEGILFGLYGSTTDRCVGEFVKWGEKKAIVELELISNKYNIYIKRITTLDKYASQRELIVYVNNLQITAPSMKALQEILEQDYYDIPKYIITSLYIIGFTQFMPISCMSIATTKQYISQIFNIDIIDNWVVACKNIRKLLLQDINNYEKKLNNLEGQLYSLKENIKEPIKNDDQNKLLALTIQIQKISNNLDTLKQKVNNKLLELNNELISKKTLNNLRSSALLLINSSNCYCPICQNLLSTEQQKNINNIYQNDIKEYKELQLKIKNIKNKSNKIIKPIEDEYKKLSNKYDKLKQEKIYIEKKEQEYLKIQNQINLLSDNILKEKTKYDNLIEQYNKYNQLINYLDITIRTKYLDFILPNLNKKLYKYCINFNLNYIIQLTSNFNFEINYNNNIISSNILSTGQRKIIDIIIILVLLSFNINFNIIFFDEILANLDINLRRIILSILQNISIKYNIIILLTSHIQIPEIYITSEIKL